MRIRTIKPEFWTSLTLSRLSRDARMTFVGLWNYVDDEGRGSADLRLIKAAIWPLDADITTAVLAEWLDQLEDVGVMTTYVVDDKPFLAVTAWAEHQSISRPRPSRLPEPSGSLPELLLVGREGKGTGKGKEQGTSEGASKKDDLPSGFEEFYAAFPRHVGRLDAIRFFRKAVESGAEPAAIIAGAEAYRDDPRRKAEFTAHPATWLNHGRWMDEPDVPVAHKSDPAQIVGTPEWKARIRAEEDAAIEAMRDESEGEGG